MSAFQIHDKDGNAISIKDLDQEACEFWKVEKQEKWYASPKNMKSDGTEEKSVMKQRINWYDFIGHNIARFDLKFTELRWDTVVEQMIASYLGRQFFKKQEDGSIKLQQFTTKDGGKTFSMEEDLEITLYCLLDHYKDYVDLMNHWNSKGYKPVQIKE